MHNTSSPTCNRSAKQCGQGVAHPPAGGLTQKCAKRARPNFIRTFAAMNQKLIEFNASLRRTDLPEFRTGDVIRVTRKIKEGGKERSQVFEGMIIAKKGGQSASPTITVRKVSFGVGVEIILPLNSPQVENIQFVKRTKAGRSKIYYVRNKSAKVLSRKLKEISVTENSATKKAASSKSSKEKSEKPTKKAKKSEESTEQAKK